MIALPALWYGGLSMLLAVVALRDDRTDAEGNESGAGSEAAAMSRRRRRQAEAAPAGA